MKLDNLCSSAGEGEIMGGSCKRKRWVSSDACQRRRHLQSREEEVRKRTGININPELLVSRNPWHRDQEGTET